MRVSVLWNPASAAAAPVAGSCAVIIDVLRATTTLTVALANGARDVVPLQSPAAAIALRSQRPGTLACGERDGRIVAGFDLGNSPFEYTRERVAGQTLAFASTNGSLAMMAVASARRRVLAAFVNAGAVVTAVRREPQVTIVCAGKLGGFSLEDAGCAGLLISRLAALGPVACDAAARLALTLAPADAAGTRTLVESAAHAREMKAMGDPWERDLIFCAGLDTIDRAFEL